MHCGTLVLFISLYLTLVGLCEPLDNGLARTPPMGWIAWERFKCTTDCKLYPDNCISERLFRAMADKLVEDGWKDLGYQYVNIDDCWSAMVRDINGKLQPDPDRFPSGIKGLAEYVHFKGLKLGIYGDLGHSTCGGYLGTLLETVDLDARTFAEWEVDMLKLDGCNSNSTERSIGYPKMSYALNATGRPIVYSCSWPAYEDGLLPKLMVGNFGLNQDQSKAQLAIWAILAAPFFMSNDLRTISDDAKALLQNKLLIYIDQDKLGQQGVRIKKDEDFQLWKRKLAHGQFALAYLNTAERGGAKSFSLSLPPLGIKDCAHGYNVYDVFDKKLVSFLNSNHTHSFRVNPRSVVLFFIRPVC
ncbi:alpha-N-acetylgalactosaminidase-like isoform X3 [Narcine bancroftii]|uniref:alpha-N-acetylgalactosaminidase-like isoform X3 n=1 Tax=Narcine bancroftii TaxID=1343680 RepID=UPI0038322C47